MDPFSAVAAASSIVQLVDFAARLVSKTHEIYHHGQDNSIGAPVLEAAAADLKVLSSKLQKDTRLTGEPAFAKLCEQCNAVTEDLLAGLRSITSESKQKIWLSFRKAFKSIWNKNKVEALEHRLATIRNELNLRLTVDVRDLVAQNDRRLEDLDETSRQILRAIVDQKDVFTVKLHSELAILTVLQRQADFANSTELEKEIAKLPNLPQAACNSIERQHDALCLEDTRVNLLGIIERWIANANERHIFWLSGQAGTGKSTIAVTVAQRHGHFTASFCFSRGGGEVGHARKLFTSLAVQLADRSPILKRFIGEAVKECSNIQSLSLHDQWRYLVLTPLSRLGKQFRGLSFLIVIDALDECDDERDIRAVIALLSEARSIKTCQIRIFLTSRPDNPIRYGFNDIEQSDHNDVVLHDISRAVVDADIKTFLWYQFAIIRAERLLSDDWPGEMIIDELVSKSSGLFIWADTACRFVREGKRFAKKRLDTVLKGHTAANVSERRLDSIYLTVLNSSIPKTYDEEEQEETCLLLREVLGSLAVLTAPHTTRSLAAMLGMPLDEIQQALEELHAIVDVPDHSQSERPIRLHHPSLRDFLLDHNRCTDDRFWVRAEEAHKHLLYRSLELMSKRLRQDMCGLVEPGTYIQDVSHEEVYQNLPLETQYACSNWVHHLRGSVTVMTDNGAVHQFLLRHTLHWFEALSLMGRISDGVTALVDLEKHLQGQSQRCTELLAFVHDAKRFALDNRWIMSTAPLQIYCSALSFAPAESLIRKQFLSSLPPFLEPPQTPPTWSATLLTLEGHTDWVRALAFSPDGQTVASSSADKCVKLWNTNSGAPVQTLEGHSDWVYSVAFSPSGLLASGSTDMTIRLWDATTGSVTKILEGHTGGVRSVAFGPAQTSLLASGACDQTVRVWDVETGEIRHVLQGHTQWVYGVAFSESGMLASGSADKKVMMWDATRGIVIRVIEGYSSAIRSLTLSSDGTKIVSVSSDQTVWLAEVAHGQTGRPMPLEGHTDWVYGVALSPDGKRIASASADRTLKLWSVETRTALDTLHGHSDWIYAVAFSPDGKLLASGGADKSVRIWDVGSTQTQLQPAHRGPVHAVAMSPSGDMFASAAHDDLTIKVWQRSTTSWLHELVGHTAWIHSLVFSLDSKVLASCSDDCTVRVWDVTAGESICVLGPSSCGVRGLAFSADGACLAATSDDGVVRLFRHASSQVGYVQFVELDIHKGAARTVAFSSDARIVTGSDDSTVFVSSIEQNGAKSVCLRGHRITVRAVAFSPCMSRVASYSPDGELRIWSTSSGESLQSLRLSTPINSVAFAQDGQPYLQTNKGIIGVNEYDEPKPDTRRIELFLDDHWILRNGRRLLWLPPRFRATSSAFHGDVFVLGHSSGFVTRLMFKPHCTAVDSPRQK